MRPIRIGVVEDDPAACQLILDYLNRYQREQGEQFVVSAFNDGAALVEHYTPVYDILLLDIEMKEMDGVTMARKLRRENDTVQIVFITGYSDYIAEGYEVDALHYLMKPVKEDKLYSVLDRAVEKLRKNEKVLNLEAGDETIRIPVYQIRYADVQGNYVTIHASAEITVKMTLRELETELDDRFYRAGRSLIVNLTQISRVTKTEIRLSDGTALPLPRGAYEGVNRAIINM